MGEPAASVAQVHSEKQISKLKPIFISSPTLVATAAFRMFFVTGEMWRDLAWSSLGYGLGLASAIVLGIPLGLAAGWFRRLSCAVEPFLTALNATPQIAFLPLIVIWVGTGMGARVLIIFLLAVLPIAISAHAAVRTIDPRLVRVAASFGAGDGLLFRSIILPSSIPFLLAGLRLAIGRGMIGVVVGEIYGSVAVSAHDQSGGIALRDRQGVRRRAHHRRRRRDIGRDHRAHRRRVEAASLV